MSLKRPAAGGECAKAHSLFLQNEWEMEMRTEKKKNQQFNHWIPTVFSLLILCVFPVYYQDYYYDILRAKYQFYCVASITALMLSAICAIVFYKPDTGVGIKKKTSIIKEMRMVDWSVVIFWFANVCSWLFSAHRSASFWGTAGRYNGVFLISLYTLMYFMLTRKMKLRREYLDALLAVSLFVCIFGITDHFQMDLLGFKEGMKIYQKSAFTSTFGHINTYTVYVAAVVCVSMVLFVLEQSMYRSVFYFGIMVTALTALVFGRSDNAYLSMLALFSISPLFFLRRQRWTRRYLMSAAAFLSVILFAQWTAVRYEGIVYPIDGVFQHIRKIPYLKLLTIAILGSVLCWTGLSKTIMKNRNDEMNPWAVKAWAVLLVAAAVLAVFVLWDVNFNGNADQYATVRGYVEFNDSWGTERGYVWIRACEMYQSKFTFIQKLFGSGADTFAILMKQYYPTEGAAIYDSAHNEYLHFLITTGFVGACSYFMLILSSLVTMAKGMEDRKETMVCFFVVLAYAAQALVNINQPLVFPFIWQFLAMGVSKVPESHG